MKQLTKRLTFANVMSAIAVFLVLGGATAFAASQLGKNSVGTKQLKKNAVTSSKIKNNAVTANKIKKNAVTGAKIKAGAVTGAKVTDGSLTGADVNAGSMPFSQFVARLHSTATFSFGTEAPIALGGYTQAAGEDDQFLSGLDVTFAATCTGERGAVALLLMDPANPALPTIENVIGIGIVQDQTPGTVTKRMEFIEYPIGLSHGMKIMGTAAAASHSFYVFPVEEECEAGSGITGANPALDVIGTK